LKKLKFALAPFLETDSQYAYYAGSIVQLNKGNLQMDKLTKLFFMLAAINDPATQMFITLLVVLGVVGLALYVVLQALKRGSRP
jgi:hypothetical protein